jgi:hypothetical protein
MHSSVIPPVRNILHQKIQGTKMVKILITSLQNVVGENNFRAWVGWGDNLAIRTADIPYRKTISRDIHGTM